MPDVQRPATHNYLFSSPEGHTLVRNILKPKIPYEPHDYQIDGICKSLDGVSLLAITPTGSGKTAYYALYMLVLQALSQDLHLQQLTGVKVPENPAMIIAYPTLGLEEEAVRLSFFVGILTSGKTSFSNWC